MEQVYVYYVNEVSSELYIVARGEILVTNSHESDGNEALPPALPCRRGRAVPLRQISHPLRQQLSKRWRLGVVRI